MNGGREFDKKLWIGVPVVAALAVVSALVLTSRGGSDSDAEACDRTADTSVSVARLWDEVLLDGIRRDFPAPTVHSRNLFHVSAAMWDAWAVYDPKASGYFVDEKLPNEKLNDDEVQAARETAISYAAYRLLTHRYEKAFGHDETQAEFDETMASLCLSPATATTVGDSPAAVGNRIAAAAIEFGLSDGANELGDYADDSYEPVNKPLVLVETGIELADPNRWQPLLFEEAVAQNGLALPTKEQHFVGPHWGGVTAFALDPAPNDLPIDPGDPPYLNDPATDTTFRDAAVEVIRYSSLLDPADGEMIDISPASLGASTLGTYDGTGYDVNPVTDEPYEPNVVPRADYGRVVAEFWADGPQSETPPGHWNTVANAVADDPDLELRIGGVGPEVDRLEWDVKMYLALNGAVHDAAVAAWGVKRSYDYVRPISMIRYMGSLGQSSDPDGPSYHPDGLPLVDGLIEVVTAESSAPGERHEALARRRGQVVIQAWAGNPEDPDTEVGGVDWIRAIKWAPYQRSTFVTPAFAGYVSGHSAFSRAGAEVLTSLTGSPYFPGGLGEWTIPAEGLHFEAGPADDVTLQWATYFDAADEAGTSRLYGGIHVRVDDLEGRIIGATVGQRAWALAERHFLGDV